MIRKIGGVFLDRNLKNWELSLIFGILVALVAGSWLSQEQQSLSDSVIRLHVVANSDTVNDQTLKLAVRDAVLAEIQTFYPNDATLDTAQAALIAHLEKIQATGQAVVDQSGEGYTVTAELTQSYFPTKEYDNFSLPAGQYNALKITLGEGEGQNWWCVAFPPLCLGATSETVEEATAAGLFTDDQLSLMTESDGGYVLKFKSMELLGELSAWLSP